MDENGLSARTEVLGDPRRQLDATIRDLNLYLDRIRELTDRVHTVIDQRTATPPTRPWPRIICGGGPSAFARREELAPGPPPRVRSS